MASPDLQEQDHLRDEMLAINRELNDLTRQLQQANAELRDVNALKNRFLAMAAHDLRQPIGVVMAGADFLLAEEGSRLSAEGRSFLRTCLNAATTMKTLVDDFLDVSIIESGRLQLNPSTTTTAQIIDGVTPLVQLVASRKQVRLQVDCPPDSPPLRVDVGKVRQVLNNLVGNAVEHSSKGGRVWLAARHETDRVTFTVRDEGPGIAPEAQERLFVPFADAGTRKTAGERSIGLGLTIARQVVAAHGGRIWVESVPGHGATFLVELPFEAAQAQE
jgi:signal transduction histidine kinase